ncbi:MAG: heparan-alpha-glucosaminide N-acetyltransferase domain-containing protein [Planctomycetota bacterium]
MNKPKLNLRPSRLPAIDALRGLVIVIMALDHSREFFGDLRIDPFDAGNSYLGLFLTRLVTHICAPTFVFLAGMSAWLYGQKVSRKELAIFLLTRGAWLVFLDFTVIYFALSLSLVLPTIFLVLAAIGASMIVLAGLIWLPPRLILLIGLVIVMGHNLLDPIKAQDFGSFDWAWMLLHERGYKEFSFGLRFVVAYPFLAWVGLMACGFGMAPLMKLDRSQRIKTLAVIGCVLTVAFFGLRYLNKYGDPEPWHRVAVQTAPESLQTGLETSEETSNVETDSLGTAYSFFHTTKYPPSLQFLLMTMGPALLILAWFDGSNENRSWMKWLLVFGRVPLFFYILHFYLLHLGSILTYRITKGVWLSVQQTGNSTPLDQFPEAFGFEGLWPIYAAWIAVLLVLYFPCKWYGEFKRRSPNPIWSYL